MNKQRLLATLPYLVALAMGLAAVVPFIDTDGRLVLEPDLDIKQFRLYYDTVRTWSWAALPQPAAHVYFDGHSLIYGVLIHLYDAVRQWFAPPVPFQQAALLTIGLTGATAHVLATPVFYATVRRLSGQIAVALLLTALFAFSPQILDINIERIDRLMMLPLIVILHASVAITRLEAGWRMGLVLGVALGVISATKVSGFAFGAFPAFAMIITLAVHGWERRVWVRMGTVAAAAALTALPVLGVLMIRFLLHAEHFIAGVTQGYANQMAWSAVMPMTPRFYYNIEMFEGYGPVFLVLVALSAVAVAGHGLWRREPTSLWLIANLTLFSALGAVTLKYSRGGYHLVPLYLYTLAIAAALLRHALAGRARFVPVLASMAALAIPTGTIAMTYAGLARQGLQWPAAIERTRFEPRAWIAAHFTPGTHVCLLGGAQWASPPLTGLGLHVTTRLFDFPYLNPSEMAKFSPPRLHQISAACDAVVLNGFHKELYLRFFRFQGLADKAREWESLYQELEAAYPPTVFASDVTAYHEKRIEIFDLRNNPATADRFGWADRRVRPTVTDGILDGQGLRFGSAVVPIVPQRFMGSGDGAVQYGDSLVLQAWAVDAVRQEPAAGIIAVVGTRVVGFDGTATAQRPDVGAHFKTPAYTLAGYAACFALDAAAGSGSVRLFAVGADGIAGEIGSAGGVPIRQATPDELKPEVCRSSE